MHADGAASIPQEQGMEINSTPDATPEPERTQSSATEESVSSTITAIESALQQLDTIGDYSIFISKEVVARPPFPYFYGLVKYIARGKPSLGWDKLLLEEEVGLPQSKKEKLSFLVRILTVVSQISQYRFDVFVSPSNILCGQDVLSTHRFLVALAASTMACHENMAKAVATAFGEGDTSLYKRVVRTRAGFKRLQAVFRGTQARKQYKFTESMHDDTQTTDSAGRESGPKPKSKSANDALMESYQEILSRKSQVQDELKLAEEKLRLEREKLARILNIGSTHKKKESHTKPLPSEQLKRLRPPYSAPGNVGRNANFPPSNIMAVNSLPPVDEAFIDKITNLSIVESNMKKKVKRIEEREQVLKQRMVKSKHKEAELKLQEQRVSDIADKIRRQQLQLKEQKLRFEQSKLVDPPSPPSSTSRPCSLCTEKEMHLRNVKDKVKRRMRLLREREAQVIGRAHELRRREIKLQKLQNEINDAQHNTRPVNGPSHGSLSPDDNRPRAAGKNQKVGSSSKLNQHSSKRKRRRTSPNNAEEAKEESDDEELTFNGSADEDGPQTEHTPFSADDIETSIRSSFGRTVPTITEDEPYAPVDDETDTMEMDSYEDDASSEDESVETDTNVKKTMTIISDDERGNTENNNPTTKQVNIIRPMKVPTPNENVNRKAKSDAPDKRKAQLLPATKTQPTQKQRHIFTFEKKSHHDKNACRSTAQSLISDMNSKDTESQYSSGRSSRKDRHDKNEWISSFDVQMKCAMNKLNELM